MCEECPLDLGAFHKYQVIVNKSDGELHKIMIKSRGHSLHMGHGMEPALYLLPDTFNYQAITVSVCHIFMILFHCYVAAALNAGVNIELNRDGNTFYFADIERAIEEGQVTENKVSISLYP